MDAASLFSEAVEIPEEEARGRYPEDYLMQSVGLLADRLAAKMRKCPESGWSGRYRLALVLDQVMEE
ncbi:MAG: hypothetical protein EON58_01085 [Alphaproteobacteria bacterium]|nr:MAG: hypothetical protein EON58_01085 [Alphaproteobacteria bacterium]